MFNNMPLMASVTLIIVGLLVCLVGALLTVELPIKAMLIDAGRWGGCPPEKIEEYDRLIRVGAKRARICLILGTLLQIIGAVVTLKN